MTSIAACPRCASNLQMPIDADADAWAACPVCGDVFCVSHAPIQALPVATLVPGPAAGQPEPTTVSSGEPAAADLGLAPTGESLPAAFSPEPAAEPIDPPIGHIAEPTSAEPVDEMPRDETPPDYAVDRDRAESVELDRLLPAEPSVASPLSGDQDASPLESAAALPGESPESEAGTAPADSEAPSRLDSLLSSLMAGSQDLDARGGDVEDASDDQTAGDQDGTPIGEPKRNQPADLLVPPLDPSSLGVAASADDDYRESDQDDASREMVVAHRPNELAGTEASESVDFRATPGKSRSWPRRLIKATAVLLVAILGGAYLAVWIGGSQADVLHLAKGPQFLLPPGLRDVQRVASDESQPMSPKDEDVPDVDSPAVDSPAAPETAELDRPASASAAPTVETAESPPPTISDSQVQRASAALFEPSPPRPPWPIELLGNPAYTTTEELYRATIEAEAAEQDFLSGDLTDRSTVRKKGGAYIKLCALAERLVLSDPAVVDREATTQRLLAKALLQAATVDQENRMHLSQIAARWLQFADRPNQGVLLAGEMIEVTAVGQDVLYTMRLDYDGGPTLVPVLLDELDYKTGAHVAVIGLIIDEPAEQLAGYQGDSEQLVLGFYAFSGENKGSRRGSTGWIAPQRMLLRP